MENNIPIVPTPSSINKQLKVKKLSAITSYIFGGLEVFLIIRFIFKLLGARAANPFVSFLYRTSEPFVIFFRGIFGAAPAIGASVIEIETIIAAVIYGLLWFGIIQLIRTLLD